MPNIKFTKAKQPDCPFCDKAIDEPWQDHVILCSGQRFKCVTCGARFKKNSYLVKHMKVHNGSATVPPPAKKQKPSTITKAADVVVCEDIPAANPGSDHMEKESNQSDWECQDPGELLDVLGPCSSSDEEDSRETEEIEKAPEDLEIGRIIRKRTQPVLYTGSQMKSKEIHQSEPVVHELEKSAKKSTVNATTQTEPTLYVYSTKTITTKWENGVKIKVVERKKSYNMS
ncbi:uncharacterized protein LOC134249760 [Saccostrea cucullata]|uniref:uncharacterized protein LOC134249760 n=1 Tax=Saccostrea cuccullata TaxID=36930 RepID=UPI002ECFE4EC